MIRSLPALPALITFQEGFTSACEDGNNGQGQGQGHGGQCLGGWAGLGFGCRRGGSACSATPSIRWSPAAGTIPVMNILVLGGSGFVGRAIVQVVSGSSSRRNSSASSVRGPQPWRRARHLAAAHAWRKIVPR